MARITGLNLTAWTGEGWFFDPFAWQFLFMIGAVLAYAPPEREKWPQRLLDVVSCVVLVAGLLVIWVVDTHPRILASLPVAVIRFVITEDKTDAAPVPAAVDPGAGLAGRSPAAATMPPGCAAGWRRPWC